MKIEFITVTHRPHRIEPLNRSISHFVGSATPWRLTVVDGTSHDLFTGYNAGAASTDGDVLAFVHDDIQFLGNPLTLNAPLRHLRRPEVGFIGVAGTGMLRASGNWYDPDATPQEVAARRGFIAHPAPEPAFATQFNAWPLGCAAFGKVVVLDGVLLLCHRRTFDTLGGFDAGSYKGFHFYDIDITFRAFTAGLTNLAAPIPLLHDSGGRPGQEWEANRQIFARKFARLLPAKV